MPKTTIKVDVKKRGRLDFNTPVDKIELVALNGVRQILEEIHRISRPITPMLTGDLRGDVKKTVKKLKRAVVRGTIQWKRPYAWYQERGYTNGPVRKYTTPGTHAHFAEESVKTVNKYATRYLRKKI